MTFKRPPTIVQLSGAYAKISKKIHQQPRVLGIIKCETGHRLYGHAALLPELVDNKIIGLSGGFCKIFVMPSLSYCNGLGLFFWSVFMYYNDNNRVECGY